MPNLTKITINDVDLAPIETAGQRVVTLAMVDVVHDRAEGTARKRFNDHKARFIEGEDFFVRNPDEARELGFTAPNGLILLTESGYLMLVKSFTDDLAWEVQRKLVNSYFRQAAAPAPQFAIPQTMAEALRLAADLSETVEAQKVQLAESAPKIAFHDAVTSAVNAQTMEEVAKALGTGRNRLFDFLRDRGVIIPDSTMPYQRYIDSGHFRVVEGQYKDRKRGERHTYTKTLVTGKGFAYIERLLSEKAAA